MGGRLKDGKIGFDIYTQRGAYPYICVEGRQVIHWQTEEDCNFTEKVPVMNVWM